MKIALFGGSFDPPHLGHEAVIKNALQSLEIDKLIIMPTFINPFKSRVGASEILRYSWVSTLWGDLERVEICDFEIAQKRPVPSIESVLHLQKLYKPSKFYLIIGADHLNSLSKWHEFKKLSEIVEFVVAKRDEIAVPPHFKTLDTHKDISSSFIRDSLNVDEVCVGVRLEVAQFYKNLKGKAVKERKNGTNLKINSNESGNSVALTESENFEARNLAALTESDKAKRRNLAVLEENEDVGARNSAVLGKNDKNKARNSAILEENNKNKSQNSATLTENEDFKRRILAITQILDEKKGENIEVFDMRQDGYFVDFVILATTMGEKHAQSLIDELKTRLKALNEDFLNIQSSEEWSVLDLGDILIHLLSQSYREKYKIEELLNSLKH